VGKKGPTDAAESCCLADYVRRGRFGCCADFAVSLPSEHHRVWAEFDKPINDAHDAGKRDNRRCRSARNTKSPHCEVDRPAGRRLPGRAFA
jgi:hypothetical protein